MRLLVSLRAGLLVGACAAGVIIGACTSSPSASTTGAAEAATVEPSGFLKSGGHWIVDSGGRVVLLHGVNVVAKDAPYYPAAFGFDEEDAAWLQSQGLRVVRLGVLGSGEMPEPGQIDVSYVDHIVATVDLLARHHIYTLLDWHQDDYGTYFNQPGYGADGFASWMTVTGGAPNNQAAFPADYTVDPALQQAFQSFWEDRTVPGGLDLQSYDVEMMTTLARKVANDPWVLGYEVMNEPWPGTSYLPCLTASGCASLEASELEPFYAKAAAAIRNVDPRHEIFLEPFVLYNFGLAPTHLTMPPGVMNAAMAFHQYAQAPPLEKKLFDLSVSWEQQNVAPAFNTEWSSENGNPATIVHQADEEDAALMSWTYWVFGSCDIACGPPAGSDVVLDEHQPPTGTNVNSPVVGGLVRPYPLVVAGTPLGLAYNASTHTMQATWSTVSPTGRSFGKGAASSIVLPSLCYPSGYLVSVSGGSVLSAPSAGVLRIAQASGAATVAVTVSPKS